MSDKEELEKQSYPPYRRLRKAMRAFAQDIDGYPPYRRLRKNYHKVTCIHNSYPPYRRLRKAPAIEEIDKILLSAV